MLVGVAFLPPSFPPSRTLAFYIIKRQNCVNIWDRVYIIWLYVPRNLQRLKWIHEAFYALIAGHGNSKCFTCVTKTIANLTTYSRKPGDYNGTIIFEFDIMKNSSPLNLKFTFFATVKTKITLLFCWTHSTLSSASKCDRVNQNKRNNQKICEKVKLDKDLNWLGMSFSWYQTQE